MAKPKLETTLDDEQERDDYLTAVKEMLGVSAAEDLRQHARAVTRQWRMRRAGAQIVKFQERFVRPGGEAGAESVRAVRDEYERTEAEREARDAR